MSLQVWLPLNNMGNQGLHNVSVTNVGATLSATGKIGNCYYFLRSTPSYLKIDNCFTTSSNGISMAFWIKIPSNASGNNQVIHIGNGAGWDNNRCTCFIRASKSTIVFCCGDGTGTTSTSSTQYNCESSAITLNVWTHVACVYTSGTMQIYLNGVLDKTYTTSIVPSFTNVSYIGVAAAPNGGEPATIYLNDVRLYDHGLSTKEVEELVRGLVLHYKLSDPYTEKTTNYAPNPVKDSYTTVSPGWDTSKHPNAVGVANWTNGYNGGVTNPSQGYHAMWNIIDNIPTIVFQDHNSEIGQTHRWLGVWATLSGYFASIAYARIKYTISFEMKTLDNLNSYVTAGVYYKKTASDSNNFYDGLQYFSNTRLGVWERKAMTCTRNSEFNGNSEPQILYIYGQYGTPEKTIYVRNVQLEIKDHVTPYTPNERTTIAKINDSSGYKLHGTVYSTDFGINPSTPRYQVSTKFLTSSAKVILPSISFSNFGNSYTFAWWQYNTGTGNMPWGFSNGNRLNLYHCNPLCWNTDDGSTNQFKDGSTTINPSTLQNAWHHMVVTGDGTDTKLYIDGVYRGKAITYKALTGTQIYLSGWDTSTSYTISGGSLSDFRIYATTLTEKQVKELYNESAAIDRNGNIFTRELIE